MVVNHSIDPFDRLTMAEMRSMVASTKGSVTRQSARQPFDELMDQTPAADCVTYEKAEAGGVHGWWCRFPLERRSLAFRQGSARRYRRLPTAAIPRSFIDWLGKMRLGR